MFMDDCGGHANPYHIHNKLACEYTTTDSASHSPIVAVMLDGRGLYGKWEGGGAAPGDLDACNGHMGPVPASTEHGTTAGTVYHYHVTDSPPYTIGCYGPVSTIDECKGLYSECTATANAITVPQTDGNTYNYQQWCTCYQHEGTCNSNQFPSLCGGQGTVTVASQSGVSGGGDTGSGPGGSGGPGGAPSAGATLTTSPILTLLVAALAALFARW
uniref:YHYH domain-containing protein n=3 Tax=Hemiselmis andersenii TaxID=464988 RepID=A0A7S0Y5P2_HEMAN|mmetsp:Transcript_38617/g.89941  ORF Transcript_38617/g.89941 Transcript_38617/m.89941 type:complete len:215 (+) Transcript_38617:1038-1682(+)